MIAGRITQEMKVEITGISEEIADLQKLDSADWGLSIITLVGNADPGSDRFVSDVSTFTQFTSLDESGDSVPDDEDELLVSLINGAGGSMVSSSVLSSPVIEFVSTSSL